MNGFRTRAETQPTKPIDECTIIEFSDCDGEHVLVGDANDETEQKEVVAYAYRSLESKSGKIQAFAQVFGSPSGDYLLDFKEDETGSIDPELTVRKMAERALNDCIQLEQFAEEIQDCKK